MCRRLAQVVAIGWLAGCPFAHAQVSVPVAESPSPRICQSSSQADEPAPGPEITLAELKFEGNLRLPQVTQDQIAAEIQQHQYDGAIDGIVDEVEERARRGWQKYGYFTVVVGEGDTRVLTSNPINRRIAVTLHIDEGPQYRLKEITFKNNHAVSNASELRSLFPINNGEIFDREKISEGIESLRKLYQGLGYINATFLPDTELDEVGGNLTLGIDADEGKLFHVGSVRILGLDERAKQQVLKDLPFKPGDIYRSEQVDLFLLKSGFADDDSLPLRAQRQLDEKSGSIALTLDLRPCSTQ
jgi:outer membrane protein assembly factor BamA